MSPWHTTVDLTVHCWDWRTRCRRPPIRFAIWIELDREAARPLPFSSITIKRKAYDKGFFGNERRCGQLDCRGFAAGAGLYGTRLHLSLLRGLPLSTEHPVEDGAAAAAAAAQLGIPFHDADLSGQFREAVISYFVRTYQEGQTPNPCVVCNRRIKFGAMWDTARAMGADCLATGHYAKIGRDRATGRYVLRRGADRAKDQSYFLCRLTQEQLSRTLFPWER